MIMFDIIKVLEFAKENNLKVGTKEGIIITDAEGCIVGRGLALANFLGENYGYKKLQR